MGGCQNYGPFLAPYFNGDHDFDNHPCEPGSKLLVTRLSSPVLVRILYDPNPYQHPLAISRGLMARIRWYFENSSRIVAGGLEGIPLQGGLRRVQGLQ